MDEVFRGLGQVVAGLRKFIGNASYSFGFGCLAGGLMGAIGQAVELAQGPLALLVAGSISVGAAAGRRFDGRLAELPSRAKQLALPPAPDDR